MEKVQITLNVSVWNATNLAALAFAIDNEDEIFEYETEGVLNGIETALTAFFHCNEYPNEADRRKLNEIIDLCQKIQAKTSDLHF